MNILDLFSGIGGFTIGFHAANYPEYDFRLHYKEQSGKSDDFFKTVAFCEIDELPQKVLKKQFPDIPIFHDVTKLKGDELPQVDIITGGFPCQDLSVAGKKQGFDGKRSILFNEMLRLANETNAKYILFENSVELVRNRKYFSIFANRLRQIGFQYQAFVFSGVEFGYPYLRKRAYIIACRNENPGSGKRYFFEPSELTILEKYRKQHNSHAKMDISGNGGFADYCRMSEQDRQRAAIFRRRFRDRIRRRNYAANCEFLRNVDGISDQLDRVGMLGNSLFPPIVYQFAMAIRAYEETENFVNGAF